MTRELLFRNTGNPAFIKVTGLTMGFVDTNDYVVAYSEEEELCYGANPITSTVGGNILIAFGDDTTEEGKQGFKDEEIKLAIWDSQTDDFYKLNCTVKNWVTGQPMSANFMPMGMYEFVVEEVGDLLDLTYDEDLAEVKLEIVGEDKADLDDYFFKLSEKNVVGTKVVSSGSGQIVNGRWWAPDQQMFANYKYIPTSNEKSVTIAAFATNIFSGDPVISNKAVMFSDEQVSGDENVIVENEYFKVISKPFKSFGNYVFVENKCDDKLAFRLYFIKDGKKVSNTIICNKGETDRALSADNYDSIYVGWIKIGVSKYESINETYSL